jgi:hypothetical protein
LPSPFRQQFTGLALGAQPDLAGAVHSGGRSDWQPGCHPLCLSPPSLNESDDDHRPDNHEQEAREFRVVHPASIKERSLILPLRERRALPLGACWYRPERDYSVISGRHLPAWVGVRGRRMWTMSARITRYNLMANDPIREIANALRRHVDAATLEKIVNELLDVPGNRSFRDAIEALARELTRR